MDASPEINLESKSESSHQGTKRERRSESVLNLANERLAIHARRHPYRSLGAALGIGYIVGAGLPNFAWRILQMTIVRSLTSATLSSDAAAQLVAQVARQWRIETSAASSGDTTSPKRRRTVVNGTATD